MRGVGEEECLTCGAAPAPGRQDKAPLREARHGRAAQRMAGPPCAAAPRADTITARGPPPMSGAAPARERPGSPAVPARGSPRQRQQGSGAARGGAQRPGHGCRFQNVSSPRRGAMTGVGGALGRRGRGGLEDSTAPRNVCGRIDGTYGRNTVCHGRGHCGGRDHNSCGRD